MHWLAKHTGARIWQKTFLLLKRSSNEFTKECLKLVTYHYSGTLWAGTNHSEVHFIDSLSFNWGNRSKKLFGWSKVKFVDRSSKLRSMSFLLIFHNAQLLWLLGKTAKKRRKIAKKQYKIKWKICLNGKLYFLVAVVMEFFSGIMSSLLTLNKKK